MGRVGWGVGGGAMRFPSTWVRVACCRVGRGSVPPLAELGRGWCVCEGLGGKPQSHARTHTGGKWGEACCWLIPPYTKHWEKGEVKHSTHHKKVKHRGCCRWRGPTGIAGSPLFAGSHGSRWWLVTGEAGGLSSPQTGRGGCRSRQGGAAKSRSLQ